LRAAILGADDGIVSVSALMLGVAAADASTRAILVAGVAGLVGGALSMAAGEFVSVSSQRDVELADLAKEAAEIRDFPEAELRELTEIYVKRGLERDLARQVARQLHEHDALGAHLRDELNLEPDDLANPRQAATASAIAFALGAALPLLSSLPLRGNGRLTLMAVVALAGLGCLGALGARLGGGMGRRAALRVLLGGGVAMAATTVLGRLIGA
jgi:VIT1/CCC1 family predicted Fe2+/Mn2+ transporter